tara:strand:- start:66 stop:1118 length:1053 start_codon:yes stop_codon:yes gene_type:complete
MAIVDKPTNFFNTLLYSGNTSDNHAITGVGFAPGLVWLKKTTGTPNHYLWDTVRGAEKAIYPNQNYAQSNSNVNGLVAFGSDGFTVGRDGDVNGGTMASWNWKTNSSNSTNTTGSINSTVSANTTSGCSVVKWTGSGSSATIGHGLGATPKMIWVKNTTDTVNWFLYNHAVITPSSTNKIFMTFNTNGALESNGSATTFTSVSDTTFGVGTDNIINGSNDSMMAYVFVEKNGFSKFGSYIGNGSTDGTFIHLGFQPAFIIVKRTDSTGDWQIMDNKRDPINVMDTNLFVNSADADTASSTYNTDFVSNGIKFRGTSGARNGSGMSYIYMAFAKNPFVTSTDNGSIPGTAR